MRKRGLIIALVMCALSLTACSIYQKSYTADVEKEVNSTENENKRLELTQKPEQDEVELGSTQDEAWKHPGTSNVSTNPMISGETVVDGETQLENCKAVALKYAKEVKFIGTTVEDFNGHKVEEYAFADGQFRYMVISGLDYLIKLECIGTLSDNAEMDRREFAEEWTRKALEIQYDLQVVTEDANELRLKETQNGIDTGTYAAFTFNTQGEFDSASFFRGSNYDMKTEDIYLD